MVTTLNHHPRDNCARNTKTTGIYIPLSGVYTPTITTILQTNACGIYIPKCIKKHD